MGSPDLVGERGGGGGVRLWFRDRWGWVVTVAGFLINLTVYNMLYCYGILLVTFQQEFGSSTVQAGWVGSIAIGFSCLASPFANPLIERFGNRVVIIAGIIMSFSGLILTSFMPTLEVMYFTFSVLYGLGTGFQLMSSVNLALQYFPINNSTRSVCIVMSGANIGMLCTGPLLLYLVKTIGWRNSLRVMGTIMLGVGLPLTYVYDQPNTCLPQPISLDDKGVVSKRDVPPGRKDVDHRKEEGKVYKCLPSDGIETEQTMCSSDMSSREEIEALKHGDADLHGNESRTVQDGISRGRNRKKNLFWRILVALTFPDLWLFCIATFGYGSCSSFIYVHLVPYVMSLGFTEETGAQAIMAIGISALLGKFLLSSVGDLVPFPKIFIFLVASTFGISLSVYLFFISSKAEIFAIIFTMGLMVNSICDTLPYSVCNQVFGVEKGMETWTIVTCFHGVGYLVSSLFGKSVDQTGSYNGAILATIIIYSVSALLCILVPVYQRLFARERFVMMDTYRDRCCFRRCCPTEREVIANTNGDSAEVWVQGEKRNQVDGQTKRAPSTQEVATV